MALNKKQQDKLADVCVKDFESRRGLVEKAMSHLHECFDAVVISATYVNPSGATEVITVNAGNELLQEKLMEHTLDCIREGDCEQYEFAEMEAEEKWHDKDED